MSDPNFIEVNEITDFIGYLKTVSIILIFSPNCLCRDVHITADLEIKNL